MVLENYTLNLTGVKATGASAFNGDSKDVSITSSGAPVTAATSTAGGSAKLEGFGTLKAIGDKVVTFVADADMKSGVYSAKMNTNASIKTFDASNASANLNLTTKLVSVTGGLLKGGSGNDTIVVEAYDNTAPTGVQVFGGKGADLFKVKGDAAVKIADYNYTDGDKISVNAAPAITKFDTNGNMTVGTNTVNGSVADNIYKFGVIDGNKKKYDYVAAANNADVKYTAGTDNLVFQATGTGNVVVDASKAAATSIRATVTNADITLGGTKSTTNRVSVGAGSTAIVDLGYGKDIVSVESADTALTLKVGREDGVGNSLKAALDDNDTLVLTTGKISDVSIVGTTKTDLKFGATSVKGAFVNGHTGAFNVQFGSNEAEKLAYTTANANAVVYKKDVSYYLGAGASSITVAADSTDDVVLDMVNDTNGITAVKLDGIAAKANVDIIATGNASIKAAVAHNGVERKFDLTAKNIVGNNPKQNKLDVAGATGVDRIVLSDAKGNADTVNGFQAGEDILVLSDVNELTKKTFTLAGTTVGLQNSKASIAGAYAANTDFDVVLSDGTAKKVALTNAATATATQKTTTVINQTNADAKVEFNITEATENNAAVVVDMTGTVSNAIDYLGKFTTIDATVGAANALIVGNEAITDIDVTGSADHGAVVWAGAKVNADINFTSSAVAAGGVADAGNILWTGALDGASSVTGFDDKDKLYVYGVDGLSKAAIVEGFDFDDNNNVVYKTGESSMTFTGSPATGNINVMYMDSTAEGGFGYKKVAYTNAAGTPVNFVTDVDVYIGTGNAEVKVANDAVAEGNITAINLSNKGAGSVEEGGAYYKDIHNIDASASAGKFLLIGDNTDNAQLKGGVNGNAIWGGGNAGQVMTGSTGVADIFWFGSTDGYDRVTTFEKEDAVYLYDATSIDAVKITAGAGNTAKVVFENTGCTLTLGNVSNIDDVKFMLNTADGGYAYYKYDSKTSAFVQQKA